MKQNIRKTVRWLIPILLCLYLILSVGYPATIYAYVKDPNIDGIYYGGDGMSSMYTYTFNIRVDNAVVDADKISTFNWGFDYTENNGYGSEEYYSLGVKGSSFYKNTFVRSSNDGYDTSFKVYLPGKLNRVHITLNMDGGERLNFTVTSIYCNDKQINSNTGGVSSAYSDSETDVYCSMENSVIETFLSPFFMDHVGDVTEEEIQAVLNDQSGYYYGQFVDQYAATIDMAYLYKCAVYADSDINQYYSHSNEESMYQYTFYFDVENALDLTNADHDEVETFYLEMEYVDQNGYGSTKTYKLDMSYDKSQGRNLNQKYLSYFERDNDDEYKTSFTIWIPGILKKVTGKLNMSGEKLVFDLRKITLNSLQVNTTYDYVSSTYWDSSADIQCRVPDSLIVGSKDDFPESYTTALKDQYGAVVSEKLYNMTKEDPDRYFYYR